MKKHIIITTLWISQLTRILRKANRALEEITVCLLHKSVPITGMGCDLRGPWGLQWGRVPTDSFMIVTTYFLLMRDVSWSGKRKAGA